VSRRFPAVHEYLLFKSVSIRTTIFQNLRSLRKVSALKTQSEICNFSHDFAINDFASSLGSLRSFAAELLPSLVAALPR